jgi:GNAT superfamily N-acetyltransferase
MTTQHERGNVLIRPAGRADLATLLEFRLAMMAELFPIETRPLETQDMHDASGAWIDAHLGRDFAAWIADLDGVAVATAGVIWFEHPPGPMNPIGREAYLLNVYTRPEARRLGLARKLVQRIVEEARVAGVRRIWLRASEAGRPLYSELGFREGNYLQLASD